MYAASQLLGTFGFQHGKAALEGSGAGSLHSDLADGGSASGPDDEDSNQGSGKFLGGSSVFEGVILFRSKLLRGFCFLSFFL